MWELYHLNKYTVQIVKPFLLAGFPPKRSQLIYINAWFKCEFSANINVLFSHLLTIEAHMKYDHPIKVCSIKLILMYNINDMTSFFCHLQKVHDTFSFAETSDGWCFHLARKAQTLNTNAEEAFFFFALKCFLCIFRFRNGRVKDNILPCFT